MASVTIKLQHGEELRRATFPGSPSPTLAHVTSRASSLFGLPLESVTLKYRDEDGDVITLGSEQELGDLLASGGGLPRLLVFAKSAPAAAIPATAPTAAAPATALTPTPAPEEEEEKKVVEEPQADYLVQSGWESFERVEAPEEEEEEEEKEEEEEVVIADKEGSAHDELYDEQPRQETPQKETEEEEREEKAEKPSKEEKEKEKDKEKEVPKEEKEEEKEEVQPTLDDILEGFSKLGTHIGEIFEQHPEVEEGLKTLAQQFSSLLAGTFQELAKEVEKEEEEDEEQQQRQQQQNFTGGEERPRRPYAFTPCPHRQTRRETPPHHHHHFHHPHHHHHQQQQQGFAHPLSGLFGGAAPSPSRTPRCGPRPGGFPFASPHPSCSFSPSASSSASPSPSPSPSPSFFGIHPHFREIVEAKLEALGQMGFGDRELNLSLLQRFRGDVQRAVQELLSFSA